MNGHYTFRNTRRTTPAGSCSASPTATTKRCENCFSAPPARPLAKLENGTTYHYVTDHLGTPQEMHDGAGRIVWAADFSAYGRVRRYLANEVENPIRFAGQYFDVESGLHYNRFRYYDPNTGRYVNQDPIRLKGGLNHYSYVEGNPVRLSDPKGLAAGDLLCQGYSGDCSSDGSYGTTAMYCIGYKYYCTNCAVKILDINNLPGSQRIPVLNPFLISRPK